MLDPRPQRIGNFASRVGSHFPGLWQAKTLWSDIWVQSRLKLAHPEERVSTEIHVHLGQLLQLCLVIRRKAFIICECGAIAVWSGEIGRIVVAAIIGSSVHALFRLLGQFVVMESLSETNRENISSPGPRSKSSIICRLVSKFPSH